MEPERTEREYTTIKESRKSRLPLAEQDKAISELQETVNNLIDRLEPVLTPTEPSNQPGQDSAAPVQSEVASILNDNNSRIYRLTVRINNTLERLEV